MLREREGGQICPNFKKRQAIPVIFHLSLVLILHLSSQHFACWWFSKKSFHFGQIVSYWMKYFSLRQCFLLQLMVQKTLSRHTSLTSFISLFSDDMNTKITFEKTTFLSRILLWSGFDYWNLLKKGSVQWVPCHNFHCSPLTHDLTNDLWMSDCCTTYIIFHLLYQELHSITKKKVSWTVPLSRTVVLIH